MSKIARLSSWESHGPRPVPRVHQGGGAAQTARKSRFAVVRLTFSRPKDHLPLQACVRTVLAMASRPFSPQRAARRIEPDKLEAHPLMALHSIRELREYMREAEVRAIERSLELGAEKEEIAETLGITRQGVDYKLRS